jgi:D-glycero-D-manno-heptose 1,7-bisphosphate phosphatase
MRRAVFLDRDGVLNAPVIRDGKPHPPAALEEVRVLQGVAQATKMLHEAGLLLAVISNQPDVARGTQQRANVEAINNWLGTQLPLDRFDVCYHDDADDCDCRKPKPGLILRSARSLDADLATSFVVGDRWRDIEAGKAAGCSSIWIDWGYAEKAPTAQDFRATSLLDAAEWILERL